MAASDASTLCQQQRVLALKVAIDWKDEESKRLYQQIRDLSWTAARYRNNMLRRRLAEAMGWRTVAKPDDQHAVTKEGRAQEKDLGEPVKSSAEREIQGAWARHSREILAGAPLPEWKPTAALSLRGRKDKIESGVRLEIENQQYVAYLRALSKHSKNGTWLRLPIAKNTRRDEYQSPILDRMVNGSLPIAKATVQVKRSALILRLTYALDCVLPPPGERVATLGPVNADRRLLLRTETQTKDYTAKLGWILRRKDEWDATRRRIFAQIGWRKGHARLKRERLARVTWDEWLHTYLHTWSRELTDWLRSQHVGTLQIQSIDTGDWPAYRFIDLIRYKAKESGIHLVDGADLTNRSGDRAAKQEVSRQTKRMKKRAEAVRELTYQLHGSDGGNKKEKKAL